MKYNKLFEKNKGREFLVHLMEITTLKYALQKTRRISIGLHYLFIYDLRLLHVVTGIL